jgi:protein TonB
MGMAGLASLRFPASLMAGCFITGTLFWTLWSLTDKTFDVVETRDLKIDFSPLKQETQTENRRQVKVVREPPAVVPDVPIIDTIFDDQVIAVVPRIEPNARISGDRLPLSSGTDRDAAPLVRVEPTYPPAAAARGTEGWVLVQYDISASGSVRNVVAVESEPGTTFDKAATDAVARWRYNPSVVNGLAVERVGLQTLIRFNLEDE